MTQSSITEWTVATRNSVAIGKGQALRGGLGGGCPSASAIGALASAGTSGRNDASTGQPTVLTVNKTFSAVGTGRNPQWALVARSTN